MWWLRDVVVVCAWCCTCGVFVLVVFLWCVLVVMHGVHVLFSQSVRFDVLVVRGVRVR